MAAAPDMAGMTQTHLQTGGAVSGDARYSGKPLLRLLDSYVLLAIDALDSEQAGALRALEPKLAGIFGREGAWNTMVAAELDLPDELPARIMEAWEDGREKAASYGIMLDPREFAALFVDTNFPH